MVDRENTVRREYSVFLIINLKR